MKRIAIFPGSFAPFHEGHLDIVEQILNGFDEVFIVHMINPDKKLDADFKLYNDWWGETKLEKTKVSIGDYRGLLVDYVNAVSNNRRLWVCDVAPSITIIRGLRDINDFLYEQKQQYYNEDFGLKYPTMYLISRRDMIHISSSAIRAINKFKESKNV